VDLRLPARLELAHLPTPLQPCLRIGARLDVDLHVKRDDLTGLETSGNKIRKLDFLMAQGAERGASAVLTCGANGSNHARDAAAAAVRLGMKPFLLLRGTPPPPSVAPDGNLFLDRVLGATIEFIPSEAWPDRDALLERWAERLRVQGETPYVIPEGGSNALGSLGYAVAVEELLEQAGRRGIDVRCAVHACGSAGTAAGIALGFAACGRPDVDVVSVAVCDDRAYFDRKIGAILDESVRLGFATPAVRARARWRVLEGYKGRGYALTTREELLDLVAVAREEGLLLDPVYTGKAFRGLVGLARARQTPQDGATVFFHTGGTFGLFTARDDFPWSEI
jgi:D-cysteine desulfhydrase